ncbi:hypothetical protein MMC26_007747 [Xylographa opegraphella]|nr:hypothetical protein [Xylographa opegraphella]
MPYLDSGAGEWYMRQVSSICTQVRASGLDPQIFTLNGLPPGDSQLVPDILAALRMFLDCCRPFEDAAYVKATFADNVLTLGLVVVVKTDHDYEAIKETIKNVRSDGHSTVGVVLLDSLSPAERAATVRMIAL